MKVALAHARASDTVSHMLTATNITYRVGRKDLISDISASFASGKLHVIIGPNGAGKSTLIKVLARLLRPQNGTVEYDQTDVGNAAEAELAKHRAVLSQAIEIAFPLTVREVVMMGRYPHFGGRPGAIDEEIVHEVMTHFDVTEFTDRNYQTLSGGEMQRVNFARVLAQLWRSGPIRQSDKTRAPTGNGSTSRYLFLDEPLTFLDIKHQIDFMKKVRAFSDSADVVTVGVVHDLNLAVRFADQILLLDRGRVVAVGKPTDVLTAERIRAVFAVEPIFVSGPDSTIHIVFE
jgi:iron complex transport system ATP-binding protein